MFRNFIKSATLLILILLGLAACTAITPGGLVAASRLDPLNSKANDIAVAVGVPNTIKLSDGDAQFHISFVSEIETISETVALQVRPSAGQGPNSDDEGEQIYIASFSETDAARITAAQTRVKALKDAGVDGEGTISIAVTNGCATEAKLETLPVSTWLQTDPESDFVRLTRQQDMLATLGKEEAAAIQDNFKLCT